MPGSLLLMETRPEQTQMLADPFCNGDPLFMENLALLQRGEGICVQDKIFAQYPGIRLWREAKKAVEYRLNYGSLNYTIRIFEVFR